MHSRPDSCDGSMTSRTAPHLQSQTQTTPARDVRDVGLRHGEPECNTLDRGPERVPGTASSGTPVHLGHPPPLPLPKSSSQRKALTGLVANPTRHDPVRLRHLCAGRHGFTRASIAPTDRRRNGPICGQVMQCFSMALMPSAMRTPCERATNSPPPITSVTLWIVSTKCVRPSWTLAASRSCLRRVRTGRAAQSSGQS